MDFVGNLLLFPVVEVIAVSMVYYFFWNSVHIHIILQCFRKTYSSASQ